MRKIVVFGASGAIGSQVAGYFNARQWQVYTVARRDACQFSYDPFGAGAEAEFSQIAGHGPFDAIGFAQGANLNDSLYHFDEKRHQAIYQANCLYILKTLHLLLAEKLLRPRAKICVISSIWQNIARQDKLSYSVSKAALKGLVTSASVDLAQDGYLINAILPGALDTHMTRENLSGAQIETLENSTLFKRLSTTEDIASLAYFLLSEANQSMTGQFIAVDLGFSHAKIL